MLRVTHIKSDELFPRGGRLAGDAPTECKDTERSNTMYDSGGRPSFNQNTYGSMVSRVLLALKEVLK